MSTGEELPHLPSTVTLKDAGFCPVDGVELSPVSQVAPVAGRGPDPRIGTAMAERYQVRRVVADGGMGRVYEALDLRENRRVALKVLHADVARDSVSLERFVVGSSTSRSCCRTSTSCRCFDFQHLRDDSHVMVMDFLEGEELRSTLKREKTISPSRVIRMLSQIAIGLDEAHRRSLIHRDLKPDNIFLCGTRERGRHQAARLRLGEGQVRRGQEADGDGNDDRFAVLHVAGTGAGSGHAGTRARIVWALAAITYESLTGQVPFRGANGPAILLFDSDEDPGAALHGEAAHRSSAGSVDARRRVGRSVFEERCRCAWRRWAVWRTRWGAAYGLKGTHRGLGRTHPTSSWRARLRRRCRACSQRKPAAAAVETDPFAEPDPFKAPARAPAPIAPPVPSIQRPPQPGAALSQADLVPAGLPKGTAMDDSVRGRRGAVCRHSDRARDAGPCAASVLG